MKFEMKHGLTAQAAAETLFPELFCQSPSQNVDMSADVSEGAKIQMAVSGNSLNPTSAELWATVSQNYVDAARKKYYDLTRFTYQQQPAISAPRGVQPEIFVPVVSSAGAAAVNTTNWETTALAQKYVGIKASLISTSFAIDIYDLARGEVIDRFLGAAIESTVSKCFALLGGKVAAVLPASLTATAAPTATAAGVIVTDSSTWGPEVVTKQVSKVFGDFGKPDSLVLNANLIAPIIPTNALSLDFEREGTYGIRHIGESAGLESFATGSAGQGMVCRHNALGVVNSVPYLDALAQRIAVRDLGTHNGIHLIMTSWIKPGSRQIWCSVETYFGAEVLAPQFLSVLV